MILPSEQLNQTNNQRLDMIVLQQEMMLIAAENTSLDKLGTNCDQIDNSIGGESPEKSTSCCSIEVT